MKKTYTLDDLIQPDEIGFQLAGEDTATEELEVAVADLQEYLGGNDNAAE